MKKYIVKQTTNWNGRGEKTATFTVQADTDTQASLILESLDGKVEVYEMNPALGAPAGSTATTSLKCVDSIKFVSPLAKTVYISAFNRPLVFTSAANLETLRESLQANFEPFGDLHPALKPSDVSLDSGNFNKL